MEIQVLFDRAAKASATFGTHGDVLSLHSPRKILSSKLLVSGLCERFVPLLWHILSKLAYVVGKAWPQGIAISVGAGHRGMAMAPSKALFFFYGGQHLWFWSRR